MAVPRVGPRNEECSNEAARSQPRIHQQMRAQQPALEPAEAPERELSPDVCAQREPAEAEAALRQVALLPAVMAPLEPPAPSARQFRRYASAERERGPLYSQQDVRSRSPPRKARSIPSRRSTPSCLR